MTADQMGMPGTVINALAFRDVIEALGHCSLVMSPGGIPGVAEIYYERRADEALGSGYIVECAGGTGNPLFTTDTAACLRAIELSVDMVIKATKVDGVYDRDPVVYPDATRFETVTYEEILRRRLEVMDATAIELCESHSKARRCLRHGG